MSEEMVDIVNEKDEVVGVAAREVAHQKTLLHRLVEVWFYNSQQQVLLQKRSLRKKNLPGLFEFTVGGHVSSGETYEEGLLKEVREETGVEAPLEDFVLIKKFIPNTSGSVNDMRLHIRQTYLYKFQGSIESLRFDSEEVDSFEWWDIPRLLQAIQEKPDLFVPFMKHETTLEVLRNIESKNS